MIATGPAGPVFGWHRNIIVDLCGRRDQQTFPTIAGDHDFAGLPAFERGLKTVQTQTAFLPFLSVATETGRLEKGSDIIGESDALFVSGRGKLAEVEFRDVPFIIGPGRANGDRKAKKNECGCRFHNDMINFCFVTGNLDVIDGQVMLRSVKINDRRRIPILRFPC